MGNLNIALSILGALGLIYMVILLIWIMIPPGRHEPRQRVLNREIAKLEAQLSNTVPKDMLTDVRIRAIAAAEIYGRRSMYYIGAIGCPALIFTVAISICEWPKPLVYPIFSGVAISIILFMWIVWIVYTFVYPRFYGLTVCVQAIRQVAEIPTGSEQWFGRYESNERSVAKISQISPTLICRTYTKYGFNDLIRSSTYTAIRLSRNVEKSYVLMRQGSFESDKVLADLFTLLDLYIGTLNLKMVYTGSADENSTIELIRREIRLKRVLYAALYAAGIVGPVLIGVLLLQKFDHLASVTQFVRFFSVYVPFISFGILIVRKYIRRKQDPLTDLRQSLMIGARHVKSEGAKS